MVSMNSLLYCYTQEMHDIKIDVIINSSNRRACAVGIGSFNVCHWIGRFVSGDIDLVSGARSVAVT